MPAPARYHALRNRAVAAVDRTFAEPVKVIWKDGHPSSDCEGVLRTAAQIAASMAGGQGNSWQIDIAAGSAVLYIDRVRYPGVSPAKGDEIKAVSREGEPYYEVARVDDRSATRLICYLIESAGASI